MVFQPIGWITAIHEKPSLHCYTVENNDTDVHTTHVALAA